MIDPSSHPELRRDNMTGIIVMRDGMDAEFPWITLWSPVEGGWARVADEVVITWPVLNQGYYSPKWAEEKRREVKALRKQNGELSHKIGALRAQLARERERRFGLLGRIVSREAGW